MVGARMAMWIYVLCTAYASKVCQAGSAPLFYCWVDIECLMRRLKGKQLARMR